MILKVQDIKFLKTILQSAGYEILKHYKNLNHIDHKDDGSPVTIADAASEQIIIDGIFL
jgi:3'-phosphoadenosine 5'-phosphosulfate (PAPS) 3'-phosphatase